MSKSRIVVTQWMVTAVPEDIDDDDADGFELTVERRGPEAWCIRRRSRVWCDRERAWLDEPIPSGRSDAFKAATRYPMCEALAIARRLAPEQKVMGWSIDEWAAEMRARKQSTS